MKYPFYYEVRFSLIAFDSENNIKRESFIQKAQDENPLEARKLAFDYFNEYLSFLIKLDRVKIVKGNYEITQPSFISEIIDNEPPKINENINSINIDKKNIDKDIPKTIEEVLEEYSEKTKDHSDWRNKCESFREEISIFLVVTDENIARDVLEAYEYEGEIEMEYEIHKVASYEIGKQDLVYNLEFYEHKLYKHFKIDISSIEKTVYHYGEFYEDGEDIESAVNKILDTPYVWNTLEDYNEIMLTSNDLDIETVITRGESHQVEFKPSLLYDFNKQRGRYFVKYIIAKTICSFLNSRGGYLFIGVNDNGEIKGIEPDYSLFEGNKQDKIKLEVDSLISSFFGISKKPLIQVFIERVKEVDLLVIQVEESSKPVFLKKMNKVDGKTEFEKEFFIRMNASTHQLKDIEEIMDYTFKKDWKLK